MLAFENVPGLLTAGNGEDREDRMARFDALGYDLKSYCFFRWNQMHPWASMTKPAAKARVAVSAVSGAQRTSSRCIFCRCRRLSVSGMHHGGAGFIGEALRMLGLSSRLSCGTDRPCGWRPAR